MPGSIPETERWIVWLRTRTYDPIAMLRAVRQATSEPQRAVLRAQLDQAAAMDQQEFVPLVTGGGASSSTSAR